MTALPRCKHCRCDLPACNCEVVRLVDSHGEAASARVVGRTFRWVWVEFVDNGKPRRFAFSAADGKERGTHTHGWTDPLRIHERDLALVTRLA